MKDPRDVFEPAKTKEELIRAYMNNFEVTREEAEAAIAKLDPKLLPKE